MFKFEFKTTLIVAILAALVIFSFVDDSEAIEILSMFPSYGGYEDFSGYLYHTAYVKTSEPYYAVSWYINDVYVGCSGGGNGETEAYFSPNTGNYPGSFQGEYYTIKAVAWSIGTPEVPSDSDTDSYDVIVYTQEFDPIIDEGIGENTGVYGIAKIWSMDWTGKTASLWMTAGATNDTNDDVPCFVKFQYQVIEITEPGDDGRLVQKLYAPFPTIVNFRLKPGKKNGRSKSDSYTLAQGDWIMNRTFRIEGQATVVVGNVPPTDKWEVDQRVDVSFTRD